MGTEDAATPYARIISNLEELGPGPMAANAAEYMSMVADGRRSFPEALPGMTSDEVRLRRERIIGSQIADREGELPLREDAPGLRLVLPAERALGGDRGPRHAGIR